MSADVPTTIAVPSNDFWTITPFRLAIPDGWTAEQTVDHLVYARHTDGEATCSVRWSRVPAGLGLEQVATISFAKILRIDKAPKVTFNGYGRHHGLQSYLRVCEFALPVDAESDTPGDTRRRGQSFLALNGPSFGPEQPIELFEIVGHFPAGDTARLSEIESIIASFHFALSAEPIDAESKES